MAFSSLQLLPQISSIRSVSSWSSLTAWLSSDNSQSSDNSESDQEEAHPQHADHITMCFIGHPDIKVTNLIAKLSRQEEACEYGENLGWPLRILAPFGEITVDYCIYDSSFHSIGDEAMRSSDVFFFVHNEENPATFQYNLDCYKKLVRAREDSIDEFSVVLAVQDYEFCSLESFVVQTAPLDESLHVCFKSSDESLWALSEKRTTEEVIFDHSVFDENLVNLLVSFLDLEGMNSYLHQGIFKAFLSSIQRHFERLDGIEEENFPLCYKLL